MKNQSILLISGSLRKASFNRMLAMEAARIYGAEPTWANTDLPLYNGDVETAEGIPDIVTKTLIGTCTRHDELAYEV